VIATTQILPQLLQAELNYTAMLAGLVLSPGGLVTMVMMPITGKRMRAARRSSSPPSRCRNPSAIRPPCCCGT